MEKGKEMACNILVIEDDERFRFSCQFLSQKGYNVDTANTYDEMLNKISEQNYHLIFGGSAFGMNSVEMLQKIKKRVDCPIVVVGEHSGAESEAVRSGAYGSLSKTVSPEMVLTVVERALGRNVFLDDRERNHAHLEEIFKNVPDTIVSVDEKMVVLEASNSIENTCGFSREDSIRKIFSSLTNGCGGTCGKLLVETIEKKQPVKAYHMACRRKQRPNQVVSLSTAPLLDSRNTFAGAVMVVRDETHPDDPDPHPEERRQFHGLAGNSSKMLKIYSLIESLANLQTTVLITGESGTGKELVAEAIHYAGVRREQPLVKVNCAALSEDLICSELFGHVKGAFTSATADTVGRFQMASGGTIFLDEIGDISPRTQSRLLRVIEEKEFERVGDVTSIRVDARVIVATNRDLRENVKRGEFREDLFYRLNIVEIALPPIRERREDIPLLLDHFVIKFNNKFNTEITLSEEVRRIFLSYPWPGNVRELENALEHSFVFCKEGIIMIDHLPARIRNFATEEVHLLEFKKDDENQEILKALEKTSWNKSKAARLLGIDRKTLYRKMDKYKIMNKSI